MNNKRRSDFLIDVAWESLAEAEFSLSRGAWGLVVRRCQEAVELDLKGVLAFLGVDHPKDHDQAPVLLRIMKAQGIDLGDEMVRLEMVSADLSRKRGPALQQEEGYGKDTAEAAVGDARWVLKEGEEIIKRLELILATK